MSILSNLFDRLNKSNSSLILSLLVLGILVYTTYPKDAPQDVKLTVKKATTLYVGDLSKGETIMPGETITILGQNIGSYSQNLVFWGTTEGGERGYIQQEALDNRGIVYNLGEGDSTLLVSEGDTVRILGRGGEAFDGFNIRTKGGKHYQLGHNQVISLTGAEMLDYELNGRRGYFLSKEKFEKLYLGKTFKEIENLYRKAFFVKKEGNIMTAEYELYVLDPEDGIRYEPTIKFVNNKAISYTLKKSDDANKFLLKNLPLVSQIIDIDLFSTLISSNTYDYNATLQDDDAPIWIRILLYLGLGIIILCFLMWLFLPNHVVSLFLCGLLCFRYPFYFLSNKVVYYMLLTISVLLTYVWMVLGLCYSFHWWYFIPVLLYVASKVINRLYGLLREYPSSRCPKCKSIESIFYRQIEVVKEYKEWRNRTEKGRLLSSKTKKWQTWSDVKTTSSSAYGGTSVSHHKENVQDHQETINVHEYNKYQILYLVQDCKKTYKCHKCGYEEYYYIEQLKELDRNHLSSYAD